MHILIVEDEPAIAQRIQRQLGEILLDKLQRIKVIHYLDDAREYIAEKPIDLLVLDLNLHGEDGFDLLRELGASSFHTIIISAYADKAITAFEYGVLDFIAKPFTRERLEQGIARLLDTNLRQAYGAKFLSIRQAGTIQLIEVEKIDYVIANGHYSDLVVDGKARLHDKSIEKLLAILPPNFERIHRSYLVNMNRVRDLVIETGGRYSLRLKNGEALPVGRSRFSAIKAKLDS
jgi:two-component system response regulator LytT